MDQWVSRWNTSSLRTFVERVPKLQTTFESWTRRFESIAKSKSLKNRPEWLPSFAKIRVIGLGTFAIAMGILAYNTCCEETSIAWSKNHFPSQAIWQASLSAEGFQLIKDPKKLSKALKNLPARVESGNQAWEGKLDGGGSWWVIYPGKGQTDPLILCRSCDFIPKKWQPVGEGWSALESVLSQIKAAPKLIAKREQRPAEVIDPREIRY
jgi:hypothetical protein